MLKTKNLTKVFTTEEVETTALNNVNAEIQDGEFVAEMHPEKRTYLVQTMPMTEAAIDPGITRDLFVALGEDLGNGAWSLRVYHKPFVRWLWLGGLIMAIGGGIAATDKRYRKLARKAREVGQAAGAKA